MPINQCGWCNSTECNLHFALKTSFSFFSLLDALASLEPSRDNHSFNL